MVILEDGDTTNGDGLGITSAGNFRYGAYWSSTHKTADSSGTYAKGRYLSSFAGLAPADQPELAILVILDEPKAQAYGGIVAAPAFRQIALETLSYLNIPPGPDADRLRVSRGNRANG